ncbi:MAG: ParB N-terminal domain-containing protein [Methylophilaceae bacterium]|nr:ParB N-terminal domain-containing protein [Methylophilaceae bacterium]
MSNSKKPMLGLPAHIKITDIVKNQTNQTLPNQMPLSSLTARERIKLEHSERTRNAMHMASPKAVSGQITDPFQEVDDAWAAMPVNSIRFYENNPRKASNEAFAELKESIRVNGILQPITVTKRPGETHYILFAGGNTRLQAVQELWQETQDPRFYETRVIIKTWRGEAAVLLAHMAENTQRNDMTFWDKANGIWAIKAQLEADLKKQLDYRNLAEELKKAGIPISLQTISAFRFASERLADLGPWLSGLTVRDVQPHINTLFKLSSTYTKLDEEAFYNDIIRPVCKKYAGALTIASQVTGDDQESESKETFSKDTLIKQLNSRVAESLSLSPDNFKRMLTYLSRFPNASLEDLQNIVRPAKEIASAQPAFRPEVQNEGQKSLLQATQQPSNIDFTAEVYPQAHVGGEDDETPITETTPEATMHDYLPVAIGRNELVASDDLIPLINQLIVLAGLGNCIKEVPAMPLGFYLGFPNDGPLDLKDNAKNRQAAWWVVAMASGQFDREVCRLHLNEQDAWRKLVLDEISEDSNSLDELELEIQNNIGGEGEFLPITWLLNPNNQVAGLCLTILALMRTTSPFKEGSAS